MKTHLLVYSRRDAKNSTNFFTIPEARNLEKNKVPFTVSPVTKSPYLYFNYIWKNLTMEFFIPAIYFLVFCFFISRLPFFQLNGIDKKWVIAAFSLKFLCGILLWAIYSYYYTDRASADIFKYFDDAGIIYHKAGNNLSLVFQILTGIVWQETEVMKVLVDTNHWFRSFDYIQINDNRIIIRLNLLFLYLSRGVFHVHTLFFSFLSLIGLIGLYRFFSVFEKRKAVLFFCSFLLPSVVFWTSGVLKESWLMLLMGLFLWFYIKSLTQTTFTNIIAVIILAFGMLFIKPFILVLLISGLIFLAFVKKMRLKVWPTFLILHSIIVLAVLLYSISTEGYLFDLMQAQQDAFYGIAEEIGNVSTISIPEISSLSKVLIASPQAFFNTLFRPFIWESENILQLMASCENLLFLLILMAIPFFYRKPEKNSLPLIFFSLSFVVALSLVIGWTTPILGTIVRYKVPLLPFFAILLFQFIQLDKLRNLFIK